MSEALARKFHEIYERLAPSFGYETRTDTRDFDPTSKNGRLMIAVCGEIEQQLETQNAKLKEALTNATGMSLAEIDEYFHENNWT